MATRVVVDKIWPEGPGEILLMQILELHSYNTCGYFPSCTGHIS